ncbi:response regulator transcription factor [Algoriphagus sp. D3-2-R+10]|uniref:response regulator transcription factor n=1 Tax=Algoriphagus aurantiacus TaxID=3103948 RepID=UPI002B383C32|nr:response regulator transcription factor [Algoriphagus sp. D3-2-R+10]MEB2773682.1 response regulator transcription factor [Algoriphagus sp. D3-2-R+10]
MKRKFLVLDDHVIVRKGMDFLLKSRYLSSEVYHAGKMKEALKILTSTRIDLLFLDINIPDGKGVDMIPEIRKQNDMTKILIFSGLDEEQYALRYMTAGADGYINKMSDEEDIYHAIESVLNKGRYMSEKTKELLLEHMTKPIQLNPLERLSGRELEVARLLAQGNGNLEISNRLNIGVSTVSTHKLRIFEKLNVKNTVALSKLFE